MARQSQFQAGFKVKCTFSWKSNVTFVYNLSTILNFWLNFRPESDFCGFLSSQKVAWIWPKWGISLWTLFSDAKKSRPDKRVLGIPFSLERPGDQEHWLEHSRCSVQNKNRTVPNHWFKAPVHLDVGGKNYTTSLATLKSVPGIVKDCTSQKLQKKPGNCPCIQP